MLPRPEVNSAFKTSLKRQYGKENLRQLYDEAGYQNGDTLLSVVAKFNLDPHFAGKRKTPSITDVKAYIKDLQDLVLTHMDGPYISDAITFFVEEAITTLRTYNAVQWKHEQTKRLAYVDLWMGDFQSKEGDIRRYVNRYWEYKLGKSLLRDYHQNILPAIPPLNESEDSDDARERIRLYLDMKNEIIALHLGLEARTTVQSPELEGRACAKTVPSISHNLSSQRDPSRSQKNHRKSSRAQKPSASHTLATKTRESARENSSAKVIDPISTKHIGSDRKDRDVNTKRKIQLERRPADVPLGYARDSSYISTERPRSQDIADLPLSFDGQMHNSTSPLLSGRDSSTTHSGGSSRSQQTEIAQDLPSRFSPDSSVFPTVHKVPLKRKVRAWLAGLTPFTSKTSSLASPTKPEPIPFHDAEVSRNEIPGSTTAWQMNKTPTAPERKINSPREPPLVHEIGTSKTPWEPAIAPRSVVITRKPVPAIQRATSNICHDPVKALHPFVIPRKPIQAKEKSADVARRVVSSDVPIQTPQPLYPAAQTFLNEWKE